MSEFDPSSGEIPPEVWAIYAVAIGIGIVVSIAITIVLCILFKKNYESIPAQFRLMEPNQVWLMLIPLFNMVWIYFVVLRLSDSYRAYFENKGDFSNGDCARSIGLWYAICTSCSMVPCLNYLAGPAALVLLIIYMVKVFALRTKILGGGVPQQTPPAL